MNLTFATLWDMLRVTLTDPFEAARRILSLGLPIQARWMAFALVVVLSVILTQLLMMGVPSEDLQPWEAAMGDPVRGLLMQGAILIVTTLGVVVVGRWFGGHARFDDALLLMTWMEFVLFVLQIVQVVLVLALPPFGLMVAFVSLGAFFWLLVSFTAYLNGFTNRLKVLAGVVATFIAAALVFVFIAALVGVSPEGIANV